MIHKLLSYYPMHEGQRFELIAMIDDITHHLDIME